MTLCNNRRCDREVEPTPGRSPRRYCSRACQARCCRHPEDRRSDESAPVLRHRVTVAFTDADWAVLVEHIDGGHLPGWLRDAALCQLRAEAGT